MYLQQLVAVAVVAVVVIVVHVSSKQKAVIVALIRNKR